VRVVRAVSRRRPKDRVYLTFVNVIVVSPPPENAVCKSCQTCFSESCSQGALRTWWSAVPLSPKIWNQEEATILQVQVQTLKQELDLQVVKGKERTLFPLPSVLPSWFWLLSFLGQKTQTQTFCGYRYLTSGPKMMYIDLCVSCCHSDKCHQINSVT
jgi:hypothetical protein